MTHKIFKVNLILLNLVFYIYILISISYESVGYWGYEYLNLLFIFTFLLILSISIKKSGIYSAFTLFLILSVVFLYGRFFLEFLNLYQYDRFDLFFHGQILDDTKYICVQLMISCLIGSAYAFIFFYRVPIKTVKFEKDVNRLSILFLKIVSVPLLYNYIIEFQYILNNGYLSIFTGQMRSSTNTILPNILPRLMLFLYFVYLSSLPSKQSFLKVSGFVLFLLFVNSLKGQRGEVLLMCLTMLWFYCNVYKVKISLKKSIVLFVTVLIFSEVMLNFRVGNTYDITSILLAPFNFIVINGLSSNVPMYMIQYYDYLESSNIPYFFGPTYDYFYRIFVDRDVFYNGPSPELIEASKFLPFHMINFINQASFYNGNGTGSSYLAEFYDFVGIYGSFFLSFAVTWFVIFIEKNTLKYRFLLLLSPMIIGKYIYMPRDSFMKVFDDVIPNSIIYLLLILFINISKGKKIG